MYVTHSGLLIIYFFTVPLEQMCHEVMAQKRYTACSDNGGGSDDTCKESSELDNLISKLKNAIDYASCHLPQIRFDKRLKPYWNKDLTSLSKSKKQTRYDWIKQGRSKDPNNSTYIDYKESKRLFRKEKRRLQFEYKKKCMNELFQCQELDNRYFWYLVNRKNKRKLCAPVKNEDGIMLTNPNDIQKEWNEYYKKLYTEPDNNMYDDDFRVYVERQLELSDLTEDNNNMFLTGGPLKTEETGKAIGQLKNNKAPGWDLVTSEHLKYSGPVFLELITCILNDLIKSSYIPTHFKKGLLVPIPKPNKDHSVKDNNRGITLISVIYKLFEKIMIEREMQWLQSNNVMDVIQSAGQPNCSCLHTSFLVQEVVAYNLNRGNSVFGAFLDTRKAFDSVWIEGLLYKLRNYGINTKFWKLIKSGYTDFLCTAFVSGVTGEWFIPQCGIHQGSPLSMYLYTIYVNDLIAQLKECGHGTCICGINVTSPTHADDMALMALFKNSLNALLTIVHAYSLKWRYTFNESKTEMLIWGADTQTEVNVKFGEVVLKPNNICKHMGIKLCTENKLQENIFIERVSASRKVVCAAQGIGSSQVPVSPHILSKLYWAIGMPKLTYGLDVSPISDKCVTILEDAHRVNSKLVQGLPLNLPKPASLATLGWMSVGSYIAMIKIMFMVRILCLPVSSVYRRIMSNRITMLLNENCWKSEKYEGPVKSILYYVKKYNIVNLINKCTPGGGRSCALAIKKHVKRIVWDHEIAIWRASCMLYPELDIYLDGIKHNAMSCWWSVTQACPYLRRQISAVLAVLMGGQPRGMQCNFSSSICSLCSGRESDSAGHILFQCEGLRDIREYWWNKFIESMPLAMVSSISAMVQREKLCFILSGLKCERIHPAWSEVMVNISKFVYNHMANS